MVPKDGRRRPELPTSRNLLGTSIVRRRILIVKQCGCAAQSVDGFGAPSRLRGRDPRGWNPPKRTGEQPQNCSSGERRTRLGTPPPRGRECHNMDRWLPRARRPPSPNPVPTRSAGPLPCVSDGRGDTHQRDRGGCDARPHGIPFPAIAALLARPRQFGQGRRGGGGLGQRGRVAHRG